MNQQLWNKMQSPFRYQEDSSKRVIFWSLIQFFRHNLNKSEHIAWASRIQLLYYYLPDIIRGFASIFRAADSSIAITYNNFTLRKDSKDLIQCPTPPFKNSKHLPSMGRVIARWMTHTITFRGRAMNQIFIILPVGKTGLSIY